jgi:hypothetical protein
MVRALANTPRLVLERGVPMVPCAYAEGLKDRWTRRIQSCGAMVPHAPKHPCPNCGQRLVNTHAPTPGPEARIIRDNVVIIDAESQQVVAVHIICANDLATDLAWSLANVAFDDQVFSNVTTTARLSGMATTHRTFGYQPPVPMRRRYGCSTSQFNAKYPKATNQLAQFCRVAEHVFRTYASDVHDETCARVREAIQPAWLIAGTPWSSGIINQTVALPYHTDKGNISRSWSAMLVARRHVEGGMLHLADYDVWFAVPHGSITIFDGQSVVHGVSPMHMTHPGGFRYSVVTYAKSGMKKCCANPRDEPRRAAAEATMAEDRRRRPAVVEDDELDDFERIET